MGALVTSNCAKKLFGARRLTFRKNGYVPEKRPLTLNMPRSWIVKPRRGGVNLPTPVLKYLLEKNHLSDHYEKLVRVIF